MLIAFIYMNNNCMELDIHINTEYMCELRRFKGHLHFIKDTATGYNIHLKDRYSAMLFQL